MLYHRWPTIFWGALLVLNQVPSAAGSNNCSEIFSHRSIHHPSAAAAKTLLNLRGKPLHSTLLFDSPHHGATLEIEGVPASVSRWAHDPKQVFRHYFTDSSRIPKVIQKSQLDAEVEPYYVVHPGVRKEIYVDLVGTFLTTPEFDPRKVGLEPNLPYIDFTLPTDVGVLFLEPGIYLVPGKPATPKWIQDVYAKFKQSGADTPPAGFERAFQRMKKYEPLEDLWVPIKITGTSQK